MTDGLGSFAAAVELGSWCCVLNRIYFVAAAVVGVVAVGCASLAAGRSSRQLFPVAKTEQCVLMQMGMMPEFPHKMVVSAV